MNKCLSCGKDTYNPKYCSLSCANRAQRLAAPRKDKTKKCMGCGEDFSYSGDPNQKFCSHSCAATYNGSIKVQQKEKKYCLFCKTKTVKNKYCSAKCFGAAKTERTISKWKDDPSSLKTEYGLSDAIRTLLLEEAGNKCSRCGWDKVNSSLGRCPLEIDHIDGNCHNNSPENLRVLCPNCHALTPTHGSLNKNSGRTYRYNRKEKASNPVIKNYCPKCGKQIGKESKSCIECYVYPKKIAWPTVEELEKQLEVKNFEELGREIGVTGNCIRKHIKNEKQRQQNAARI